MSNSPHVTTLLAQADLLLLLAEGLRSPVGAPRLTGIEPHDIRAIVAAADLDPTDALCESFNRWHAAYDQTSPQQHSDEYHRLFEAAIACPLNETAYIRRDKGAVIGDLCGFYRAFGWEARDDAAEKPDHLTCQLEFAAALLVMLAKTRQENQAEAQQVTCEALIQFANVHVSDWLPAVGERLRGSTRLTMFSTLAGTMLLLWEALSRRHGWPFDPDAQIAPAEDCDSPFECGAADAMPLTNLTIGGTPH